MGRHVPLTAAARCRPRGRADPHERRRDGLGMGVADPAGRSTATRRENAARARGQARAHPRHADSSERWHWLIMGSLNLSGHWVRNPGHGHVALPRPPRRHRRRLHPTADRRPGPTTPLTRQSCPTLPLADPQRVITGPVAADSRSAHLTQELGARFGQELLAMIQQIPTLLSGHGVTSTRNYETASGSR